MAQELVARKIADPKDLVGGKGALGKVGDFLLANDRIVVVIDDIGKRQGFAESGGNIVDAARRDRRIDLLTQLITYFDNTFPRQAVYERIEVARDGSDGREAAVRVSGREMKDPALRVTTEYTVRPGELFVRVETTVVNTGAAAIEQFELGDAVQWGLTDHFAPGIGHAIGGRTLSNVEWLAGPGEGVSYGYTVASGTFFGPNGSNWSDANVVRATLRPNEPVRYSRFLIVGTGDIASVSDVVFALRGARTGALSGRVAEEGTGAVIPDSSLAVQSAEGLPQNLIKVGPGGVFRANLPPGEYRLVPSALGRSAPRAIAVTVRAGVETRAEVTLGKAGRLKYQFTTAGTGKPLPVKVTLKGLGTTADPYLGPGYQARGAANVIFAHTGAGEAAIPPGFYTVYASRGIEYTLFRSRVAIEPGKTAVVSGTLERVVDTAGAIAGDFHLHSEYSADSNVSLRDKIIGLVAEGVEFAVSSDHNAIADYAPAIRDLGLKAEIKSAIGDEVTLSGTIHFNVFPLEHDPERERGGAIDPAKMKVQEMIDAVRRDPGDEVVQLNHPRAGNIGYFSVARFDPATLRSPDPAFTLDFDAIEVFNGKRVAEAEEVLRDWFALLNGGYRFAATGNSDSHKLVGEEAGYPRNYVLLGKDDPGSVTEDEIVRAVKSHRIVVTNGPFLRVSAGGRGVGELVASGGKPVEIAVSVSSAPWIDVSEVSLVENGIGIDRRLVPETARVDKGRYVFTVAPKRDAWYVVIARGNRSLAPVVPNLAEREVMPFAFTNPIWVDVDGDGKITPPRSLR